MTPKRQAVAQAMKKAAQQKAKVPADLKSLENKSMSSLENALAAIKELSAARLEAKLSVARLAGVARELRELIKVMSVYGC